MSTQTTTRTSGQAPSSEQRSLSGAGLLVYLLIGIYFGIVLTKSEVVSWYRIQEMFRFQDFHMYGIIGVAVFVAMISVAVIKARHVRTVKGQEIVLVPKQLDKGAYRYWIGGTIFGLGWALAGACPGPIFALVGNGLTVMAVTIASAVAGTWLYGVLKPRLPH
jgi:uncharacterized membrane protein YedE/YeeE